MKYCCGEEQKKYAYEAIKHFKMLNNDKHGGYIITKIGHIYESLFDEKT